MREGQAPRGSYRDDLTREVQPDTALERREPRDEDMIYLCKSNTESDKMGCGGMQSDSSPWPT